MALQEGRRRDPLPTLLLGAQVVKERRASWWADVLVVGRPREVTNEWTRRFVQGSSVCGAVPQGCSMAKRRQTVAPSWSNQSTKKRGERGGGGLAESQPCLPSPCLASRLSDICVRNRGSLARPWCAAAEKESSQPARRRFTRWMGQSQYLHFFFLEPGSSWGHLGVIVVHPRLQAATCPLSAPPPPPPDPPRPRPPPAPVIARPLPSPPLPRASIPRRRCTHTHRHAHTSKPPFPPPHPPTCRPCGALAWPGAWQVRRPRRVHLGCGVGKVTHIHSLCFIQLQRRP